ncbi:BTAD domain-containing putative transcriptional regulator [Actinoplanes sp. ATCC 53533]|uniref:BTAD domain-containing putative transcriptional regulator n=1 Tax=Actinoplanes sp. ATCC 53533 TaxID=1288362 RepID=UPI0013151694|nr:BTAD domain-containing putative transcriptional regulator [Actinoplanes sp. ATCC 53533]
MHPTAKTRRAPAAPGVTCRVVAAAAGYGKTTAMRGWYPADRASWHRGLPPGPREPVDALAGVVLDEVHAGASQLVFDDLPRLPPGTARSLTETLARLTSTDAGDVDVVLASRWPLGTAAPALPRADVGPAELSLSVDRIADLLTTGYELTDGDAGGYDLNARDLPERIHQATAGWPALVHLAAETLRTGGVPHGPLLPVIAAPGGLIANYLEEEVLPALPEAAARLLAQLGDLAPVGAGLCRALGHPHSEETLRLLTGSGLLTTAGSPRPVPGGPAPARRIVPVIAEVIRRSRRTDSHPAPDPTGTPNTPTTTGTSSTTGTPSTTETTGMPGTTGTAGVPGTTSAAEIAAGFFDEHGPPVAAALAYHRSGRAEDCARVLNRHGEAMLGAGEAETLVELLVALPVALRTPRLWLLLGDAQRATGALDAAAQSHAAAAPGLPPGSAALAWRTGRIHYQRGEARAALAAFAEAGPGPHPPVDAALLAAWAANSHLLAGCPEAALRCARDAVTAARTTTGSDANANHDSNSNHDSNGSGDRDSYGSGDRDGYGRADRDRDADELAAALATAHVSLALCLGALGDDAGSEESYRQALPIAERVGNVVLLTRIYTNRTYRLLCAARYPEALAAARTCGRYAAAARQPSLRAIAVCNEADALAMLGRYDEAVRQYERAISAYRAMGSRRVAGAQLGLGEVYRRRGWREQARAAYDATVRVAGEAGNVHVLVPAEAGLALVLLADDPDRAAGHAAAAAARTGAAGAGVPALLAQGWVALCRGDREQAGALAERTCATARAQGDRPGLADALELRGAAQAGGPDADPVRARAALRECHAIWTDGGAAVEAARVMVTISRLPGAGPDDRILGLIAAERLQAAGAVVIDLPLRLGRPAEPAAGGTRTVSPGHANPAKGRTGPADSACHPAEVAIQALGRFEVRVDGEPVPSSRWQSRKARDLLRVLVARRGRPMPRDELCELLWPDDDPAKTGHRLSVLLSIVRGVLDPVRARPADHYLVADLASVALDVSRARVDVEDFLSYVARARRLLAAGDLAEARDLLVTVDRHHGADAFSDEPYAPWSAPLREETRAAYLSMLRMLVQVSGPAGVDAAVGYLLRLLERDPYDEAAHRGLVRCLVRAGRHGEARRAFDRYGEAMRAIGVRPPDRSLLAPRAAVSGRSR